MASYNIIMNNIVGMTKIDAINFIRYSPEARRTEENQRKLQVRW
jgi:hypothetical protein